MQVIQQRIQLPTEVGYLQTSKLLHLVRAFCLIDALSFGSQAVVAAVQVAAYWWLSCFHWPHLIRLQWEGRKVEHELSTWVSWLVEHSVGWLPVVFATDS